MKTIAEDGVFFLTTMKSTKFCVASEIPASATNLGYLTNTTAEIVQAWFHERLLATLLADSYLRVIEENDCSCTRYSDIC